MYKLMYCICTCCRKFFFKFFFPIMLHACGLTVCIYSSVYRYIRTYLYDIRTPLRFQLGLINLIYTFSAVKF